MKNKNSILTIIAILSFALTTMAQVPSYVPTSGLVAWYPFNGNANDGSGNANNLTNNNSVSFTLDRFGNSNSSPIFNGTNQYFSKSSPTIFTGNSNRTISFWYKQASNITSTGQYTPELIDIWDGLTGTCYTSSSIEKSNDSSMAFWGRCEDHGWAISRNMNLWEHVVLTYSSNILHLYRNGILLTDSAIYATNLNTTPAILTIGGGRNSWANFTYFNGNIDDIGFWNRALTSQEIYNLYHSCSDSISTQPTDQYGFKGTNKTFSFVHSGSNVNYQWQTNPLNFGWLNLSNSGQYSNTATNSFTISGISVANHYQPFRVISSISGCNNDTSNVVHLNITDISYDSLRAARLQNDSSRLTNDSINYLARIFKLSNDSSRLTIDSINYLSSVSRLRNDSTRLTNDSIFYLTRISKLSNDSSRLTTDSINYLASISFLKSDTTAKGSSIRFLQTDTTNKGSTIVILNSRHISDSIALLNKHDTVYIASSVTSDTLKISIHTGISQASPTINSLKVYPNPAATILHIDLSSPGYFTAKISGVTGQSIISPTSGTIDISALANGIYILTVYDSTGKLISTNKILIAK